MIDVELLRAAGLSEAVISDVLRKHAAEQAEGEIKQISACSELAALRKVLEEAEKWYRIVITRTPTGSEFKVSLWNEKTVTVSSNGTGRSRPVTLDGVSYPSATAACAAMKWEVNKDSAVRVLVANARKGNLAYTFDPKSAEPVNQTPAEPVNQTPAEPVNQTPAEPVNEPDPEPAEPKKKAKR